ncbi:MAG TPA: 3-phosphoserine/phosphohydroxythreonine transaminase [Bacilli bacterium]|nr:3-phosphoserine/phosphohydroxythreonine transaminase [Bacilli bacterium]HPS18511.1 3-phosphoserine/phosphohydroxythreonine transaminase [Bacilli bacterium]
MKENRIYNFSAGPAMLPEEVLEQVAAEMLDKDKSGMSVMEMSHRSKVYQNIIDTAEADLRKLIGIPDNYKVLFLQGGATLGFGMIPMNFATTGKVDIINTGVWTKKAINDAKLFAEVNVIASSEKEGFKHIPSLKGLKFDKDADYVYICDNNTIYGSKYKEYPDTGDIPLVADMSSCFLSEPIDVKKFGLIYAGAQKNVGPAGVTIYIIRDDLLARVPKHPLPAYLDFRIHVSEGSMYNTPPTFAIYVCGLVFKWLLKTGGLEARKALNEAKAKVLYDYLDHSKFYIPYVDKEYRSLMNVTFRCATEELDNAFLEGAKKYRFTNLKGHRSTGGLRASLYNAMPIEGVKALVAYMKEFEDAHK